MKEFNVVLRPGDVARVTTEQHSNDVAIHAMGLADGRMLLTGGAELVEAIEGSDWDPRKRIAGIDEGNPWDALSGEFEANQQWRELRERVQSEATKFYRLYFMRPNMVILSLDYRHLQLKQICGIRVGYGHQPLDEVRCVHVPFGI